jgi:hypothetical protein
LVVGSLAATVASMKVGFDTTLLLAKGIYLMAMLAFQAVAPGVASGMPGKGANDAQDQA